MNTAIDTWESRINLASKIMGLDPSTIEKILDSDGYEITRSEFRMEMLSDENVLPFGDLRKLFCEGEHKIPLPKLRMAMKFIRGPTNSKKTDTIDLDLIDIKNRYGINTSLEDLDITHLLQYYNPSKKNKIHDILINKYESKYGPFIAFKPGTNDLAIEDIINYISDVESGYPTSTSIEVDGEFVELIKVGQFPNQLLDEDPMFKGVPLRRSRSTENYLNWNGIDYETRTFFRVLVERNDINPSNRIEAHQVIKHNIKELKTIFPDAYIEWKNKKTRNELPKLTIPMSELDKHKVRSNNPFGIGTNRLF